MPEKGNLRSLDKDYGRRPHLLRFGETYRSRMERDTELARRGRGESWVHSDDKKPYLYPGDYDEMEMASTPYNFNIHLRPIDLGAIRRLPATDAGLVMAEDDACKECQDNLNILASIVECVDGIPDQTNIWVEYVDHPGISAGIVEGDGSLVPWAFYPAGFDCLRRIDHLNVDCDFGNVDGWEEFASCQFRKRIVVGVCGIPQAQVWVVKDLSCTDTISGSDEVTQNTTEQYSIGCEVTWSVSGSDTGTPPSISASGLLSVNDGCGALRVTATNFCGNTDSIDVRVTDSGSWTLIDTCNDTDTCDQAGGCGLSGQDISGITRIDWIAIRSYCNCVDGGDNRIICPGFGQACNLEASCHNSFLTCYNDNSKCPGFPKEAVGISHVAGCPIGKQCLQRYKSNFSKYTWEC